MASKTLADLKNKDLLRTKGYIDHEWVDSFARLTP